MTVITLSRQYGSGGDEIAGQVCQRIGYRQFDKLQIAQAAVEAGLSEQEAIDYSEETYKVATFLDRLFRRPVPLARARVRKEEAGGTRVVEKPILSETAALALVQKAVQAAYETGNMVIVGRGGQVILKDCPNALHIRIEAPWEERIYRIKAQIRQGKQTYDATVNDRRAAQDLITEKDTASADYIRQFYGVDWADPSLYHAILNTGKLSIEQAAQVIVGMVHSLFP